MKKVISILFSVISLSSFGSFLFEPYLGYTKGAIGYTKSNSPGFNGDYGFELNGISYGGKLGIRYSQFVGGIDYSAGKREMKFDFAPGSGIEVPIDSSEYNSRELGVFLGFHHQEYRIWGTYYFDYSLEASNGGVGNVGDEYSGKGFGVGLGGKVIPFISVNVELKILKIEERNDAGTGEVITYPTANISDYYVNEILVTVSFPFEI